MEKHYSKFFRYFLATATLIIGGLVFVGTSKVQKETALTSSFAQETEVLVKEEKEEVLSPDGSVTLILRKTKENEEDYTQTLSVKTEADNEEQEIYQVNSNEDYYLSIPYNTFSPSNKYIFLVVKDKGEKKHIVLRTDEKYLTEESLFLEVERRFYDKYGNDFVVTTVTGWGGNGLLVINTDFPDGGIGPSFWFDLSNFGFIRLSNRFN